MSSCFGSMRAWTLAVAGSRPAALDVRHFEHGLEQSAFGVTDLVENREMIFPRAGYVRPPRLAPFFPDEPVLNVESFVFVPANGRVEGCVGSGRQVRGTHLQRGTLVEVHVAIHRRYL